MKRKIKLPKLGLYSRFFLLFNLTTVLLAAFITFGFFTISESDARAFLQIQHAQIYTSLTNFDDDNIDLEKIQSSLNGPEIEVKVVRGEQIWTTWDAFPELDILFESADKINSVYFTRYRFRYYVLAKKGETHIAFTTWAASFIIYPGFISYWPWLLALCVLIVSYQMLRRWLRPVADALKSAKQVSEGHFDYRIAEHSNTELAELTRGLNKMAEDLKQMFDAKQDLLLAISHELRTPMARMKVSLALLAQSKITDDLSHDIAQMDGLIEQLLEGERLSQGHNVLHLSPYYLPSLINDVIEEQSNSVIIDKDIPEEAITIDVGRIRFLLRNLLRNAIEHSPVNTNITMSIEQTSQSIVFEIKDNGPGIPEALQEMIFEPFFRLEDIQHRSTQGVGLGLYLCRKIAVAHGGSLTLDSEIGKGSSFRLSLPKR